jgi:hypothetical protein
MTEYDTMVPVAQHISEADRISYLHQAVAGETLLGTVRMQCKVHILNGNTPYTFDPIVALYRTVCANLVDRNVQRPRNTTMSTDNHNIFDSDDEDDTKNINSYCANNHNFVDDDGKDLEDNTAYLIFYNNRVYRPQLNKTTWEALSPEGQQTWCVGSILQ